MSKVLMANGLAIAICFQITFFWACDSSSDSGSDSLIDSNAITCEGCHTDKTSLQEYAESVGDTPSGGG